MPKALTQNCPGADGSEGAEGKFRRKNVLLGHCDGLLRSDKRKESNVICLLIWINQE